MRGSSRSRASRVVVGDWRLTAYMEMRRVRGLESKLRHYRRSLRDANRRVEELGRQVGWAESEARTAKQAASVARTDAAHWRNRAANALSAQLTVLRERLAAFGLPDEVPAGGHTGHPGGVAVTVVVRGVLAGNWLPGMAVRLASDDGDPVEISSRLVRGVYAGHAHDAVEAARVKAAGVMLAGFTRAGRDMIHRTLATGGEG